MHIYKQGWNCVHLFHFNSNWTEQATCSCICTCSGFLWSNHTCNIPLLCSGFLWSNHTCNIPLLCQWPTLLRMIDYTRDQHWHFFLPRKHCPSSSVQDGVYALRRLHMLHPALQIILVVIISPKCNCHQTEHITLKMRISVSQRTNVQDEREKKIFILKNPGKGWENFDIKMVEWKFYFHTGSNCSSPRPDGTKVEMQVVFPSVQTCQHCKLYSPVYKHVNTVSCIPQCTNMSTL